MTKRSSGLRHLLLASGLAAVAIAGMANAGQRDTHVAERAAKALAAHDATVAVTLAEQAVSINPRDAGNRLLLGQSYLAAGRFASARAALQDAATLAPANGKIALNLALAAIATGDWQAARQVLASHRDTIPATDLGLATALAGDPASGVAILTAAVRAPDATVKTRQNLALALALAGRWDMARVAASTDLSPADLDARIQQWTVFAQPRNAGDQVAALLGVKPIADPGQPVALALAAPAPVAAAPVAPAAPIKPVTVAASTPAAIPAPMATAAPVVAMPVEPVSATAPVSTVATSLSPSAGFSQVVFGPSSPVVQPLPVATIRPTAGAARVALAKPGSAPAAGRWYVQLGAFGSANYAHGAWTRIGRRMPSLAGYEAHGASVKTKAGTFYRLSVGGFDRIGADQLCRRYRAAGGVCFVRSAAGDQLASWVSRKTQLASR